nr:MAG TPA: hypothetical protein [Caudoviricetes sp.]
MLSFIVLCINYIMYQMLFPLFPLQIILMDILTHIYLGVNRKIKNNCH